MKKEYEKLLDFPYTGSKRNNKMSLYNRAAQFAPFSALSGYEYAIKEATRITDNKRELGEFEIEKLNYTLKIILEEIQNCPLLEITYFVEDKLKYGGEYITIKERIKKIDDVHKELILENGMKIAISYILDISIVK